jgi:hypothetical protein
MFFLGEFGFECEGKVEETYFFEEYIGLTGPLVNFTAHKYLKYVPENCIRNR